MRWTSLVVILLTLTFCQSKPATKKDSSETEYDEAVDLLARFTRSAVVTKHVRIPRAAVDPKEGGPVRKDNVASSDSKLFSAPQNNGRPLGTDPPIKSHHTVVKDKAIIIKDKTKDETDSESNDDTDSSNPSNKEQGPKFDEKAIQRALMVFGGLCSLLLVYFGIKFAFIKKRRVGKHYGRESSEMDLLENMEDDDEEEEEDDTLFDINAHRRT